MTPLGAGFWTTDREFAWYGKEPGVIQPHLVWETVFLGAQ